MLMRDERYRQRLEDSSTKTQKTGRRWKKMLFRWRNDEINREIHYSISIHTLTCWSRVVLFPGFLRSSYLFRLFMNADASVYFRLPIYKNKQWGKWLVVSLSWNLFLCRLILHCRGRRDCDWGQNASKTHSFHLGLGKAGLEKKGYRGSLLWRSSNFYSRGYCCLKGNFQAANSAAGIPGIRARVDEEEGFSFTRTRFPSGCACFSGLLSLTGSQHAEDLKISWVSSRVAAEFWWNGKGDVRRRRRWAPVVAINWAEIQELWLESWVRLENVNFVPKCPHSAAVSAPPSTTAPRSIRNRTGSVTNHFVPNQNLR